MFEPRRYKLVISYRGTRYHGWQEQSVNENTWRAERPPNGQGIPTVQETLARTIRGVVGHPIILQGSSRTDSGVHAKGQVAHFDTDQFQIPLEGLRRAVNARLPEDVVIRTLEQVPRSFDAIRSTTSKRYQYFIWTAENRPVFFSDLAWHRWQKLDVDAMTQAAAMFVGSHDFAAFAKPGHGRENTIRNVLGCDLTRRGPVLVIGVHGTGFLWNMVRIMVGTLVDVGLGRYKPADIAEMFESRDRKASGGTAPAHGLYLQWIKFREEPESVVGSQRSPEST